MTTHKQLADNLGVSIQAVAIIREVLRGSSAHSRRALAETEEEHQVEAARWLARYRGCHGAAGEITKDILKEVKGRDGEGD